MILNKEHIKRTIETFFSQKPVKKVWLFGSYARGDADENSDVDVLIDFEENSKIGIRYLVWHEEMEQLLNKKVQIVSNASLSKFIRPFVEEDKVLIYEK